MPTPGPTVRGSKRYTGYCSKTRRRSNSKPREELERESETQPRRHSSTRPHVLGEPPDGGLPLQLLAPGRLRAGLLRELRAVRPRPTPEYFVIRSSVRYIHHSLCHSHVFPPGCLSVSLPSGCLAVYLSVFSISVSFALAVWVSAHGVKKQGQGVAKTEPLKPKAAT